MDPATPMATLVAVVTQVTSWFSSMMSTLFQNELFLVVFGIFIVGASIGLVKRVIS